MSDDYCSTCILNVINVDYLVCIKPCEVENALNITPTMATVRVGDAVPSEHVSDKAGATSTPPPTDGGSHPVRAEQLRPDGSSEGSIPDGIGYKRRWPAVPPKGSRTPLEDAEARRNAMMLQRVRLGQTLTTGGPDRREYPKGYAIPQSARFLDRDVSPATVQPTPLTAVQVDRVRERLIEYKIDKPDFMTAKLMSNPHFLAAVSTFGVDQVLEMLRAHDTLGALADIRAPMDGGKEP
jgi:hypothetical protein